MLRHCVMFRWAEDVGDDAKAEISSGLDELASLEGVISYRHGPDAGIVDGNWDYAIVGEFESVDAYQAYATDAGHLELIAERIRPAISARAAVQYHC